MNKAILTKVEAQKLLNASFLGHSAALASLDLGITSEEVLIGGNFCTIRGQKVPIKSLQRLKDNTAYVLEGGALKSIDFFGEDTNLFYKLKPTNDWPTIMLSSVPMHRFKTISPKTSASLMVNEVSPVEGRVLDTCCGLGYTAILAAKSAEEVMTFERDNNVLRIAEYNPYSGELFSNKKIKLHKESVFEGIKKLKSNYFDRIIHDPPTVSFAKELYSEEFYRELFRVAKSGAILYHYCPNPGKTKGAKYWPNIKKWLEKAGFKNCSYNEKSSGIRCLKN